MHESTEHHADREPAQEGRAATGHRARVNQPRHEPMPASHGADNDQSAVGRNEEHSAGRQGGPAAATRGDAVRDMMGGLPPQGDVPDAPATQIAAADNEEDQVTGVNRVANAVPGKPDGEVDTRS
jgi:hypothetical protein